MPCHKAPAKKAKWELSPTHTLAPQAVYPGTAGISLLTQVTGTLLLIPKKAPQAGDALDLQEQSLEGPGTEPMAVSSGRAEPYERDTRGNARGNYQRR